MAVPKSNVTMKFHKSGLRRTIQRAIYRKKAGLGALVALPERLDEVSRIMDVATFHRACH